MPVWPAAAAGVTWLPELGAAVLAAVVAITLHEAAHGYAALALGDDTAKRMGRLSLNPLRHVDPVGTLLVPGVLLLGQFLTLGRVEAMFGWAKPVPVNLLALRDSRRGMMLVAAAGPLMNFALAWLAGLLAHPAAGLGDFLSANSMAWVYRFLCFSILANLVLGLFNLLPIPPLDGGRILAGLLPGAAGAALHAPGALRPAAGDRRRARAAARCRRLRPGRLGAAQRWWRTASTSFSCSPSTGGARDLHRAPVPPPPPRQHRSCTSAWTASRGRSTFCWNSRAPRRSTSERISILSLVDQFLAVVEQARRVRLEIAADWLVMAAWLAWLKSRLLLPPEEAGPEEDAEALAVALADRLRELERMRAAAAWLNAREQLGREVFNRGLPESLRVEDRSGIAADLRRFSRPTPRPAAAPWPAAPTRPSPAACGR